MQANATSHSPATSPPSAAASLVGWTWTATDIQVGAAMWRLQCWNMPLEILVHFLNRNWSQTHQLISTIVTVVVTGMACIFEIDLLLDAHKTRDRDIVQLCLLSGHCCCSRKTCNTEARAQYPDADIHRMPSLHSHTCTSIILFWMKLSKISKVLCAYIKHLLFTLRLLISKK